MSDTSRIHMTRDLPVDPGTLWQLWTDPQHLTAWFGPHVRLNARSGGTFAENWTKDGRPTTTIGTVTVCAPPEELAWTWADDDWPGPTLLSLHFKARPGGTRLTLVHGGWDALPSRSRDQIRDEHAAGWTMHLDSLERYCNAAAVKAPSPSVSPSP